MQKRQLAILGFCFAPLATVGCIAEAPTGDVAVEHEESIPLATATQALVSDHNSNDWRFRHDTFAPLAANRPIGLYNAYPEIRQAVRYASRDYGINLVWTSENPRNVRFLSSANKPVVENGDLVAIYVGNGGYLKYGERRYGINLEWTSTPAYQWRVYTQSGQRSIYPDTPFRLYNTVARANVVYCEREYGINWKWSTDCTRSSY